MWIDVQDQLPKRGVTVLGWSILDGGEYVLASLDNTNNWYCQCLYGVSYHTLFAITHWAILPEEKPVKFLSLGELINA